MQVLHWSDIIPVQATRFGKRDGVLTGLAVVSNLSKNNVIRQTRGWKQGVVHGVSMLQRSDYWKPEAVSWIFCPTSSCHTCG